MNKSELKRVFIATITALLVATSWAADLSLEAAKNQGLVGEQENGYLGAVSTGNPDVQALVNDVNAKRRAQYNRIAAQNQIALADVENLAGAKAIEKTQVGNYVNVGGRWQRK